MRADVAITMIAMRPGRPLYRRAEFLAVAANSRANCFDNDTTRPPDYPAYSGGGSKLTIYLTPVNAPLPDSWQAVLGDYSPSNPSPVVYRLVS